MNKLDSLGFAIALSGMLDGASLTVYHNAFSSNKLIQIDSNSEYKPLSKEIDFENLEDNYDDILASLVQLGIENHLMDNDAVLNNDDRIISGLCAVLNEIKQKIYQNHILATYSHGENDFAMNEMKKIFTTIQNIDELFNSCMILSDEERVYLTAVESYCEFLGITSDTLNEKNLSTLIGIEDIHRLMKIMDEKYPSQDEVNDKIETVHRIVDDIIGRFNEITGGGHSQEDIDSIRENFSDEDNLKELSEYLSQKHGQDMNLRFKDLGNGSFAIIDDTPKPRDNKNSNTDSNNIKNYDSSDNTDDTENTNDLSDDSPDFC